MVKNLSCVSCAAWNAFSIYSNRGIQQIRAQNFAIFWPWSVDSFTRKTNICRNFDPDLPSFYLRISCNIKISDPHPPKHILTSFMEGPLELTVLYITIYWLCLMVTFKTNIAGFHTFPPETAITNPCLFTKFIIFLILALKYRFCNNEINLGFFRHLKFAKKTWLFHIHIGQSQLLFQLECF